MAAFIDDRIFSKTLQKNNKGKQKLDQKYFAQELSKNINGNASFVKRNASQYRSETYLNFSYDLREYIIELSTTLDCNNIAIYLRKTNKVSYNKIKSRHIEILILKDLFKIQYQNSFESTYFIHQGCIIMAIKLYFSGSFQNKKHWIDHYSQIIIRNFHHYHNHLQRTFQTYKISYNQYQIPTPVQQDLHITQSINTISANFDISEEKSHFKTAQQAIKTQKAKIAQVNYAVIIESQLQKTNHILFQVVKNYSTSLWISLNLNSSFQKMQKQGKKIITLPKTGDRKIQDFLFNIVKVQVKDKIPRPIAQGGSSYIYLIKAFMTYINSVDYTSYKKKDEKSQRIIVIKTLKPEFQKKMINKLIHQKQVVSKLKGSCSNFLPKYYGTEKDSDLSHGLLMEHLHGEQLDKYLGVRNLTISLWTKICLLLNIVHGIRHLINYGVAHFDIKPINIIVCKHLLTKILDFGEAYHKDLCTKQYCPGYTFPYAAPQIYARYDDHVSNRPQKQLQLNQKQDVYAFGMIMYQVLFSNTVMKISYEKLKKIYYEREIYQRILISYETAIFYGKDLIISTLLGIIIKCLHPQPQNRPKFDWIGVSLKLILNTHINH